MRNVKKIVAAMMAVMCVSGVITPFSTMATFDPCDVNHDGTVNMSDALEIHHHLLGTRYATNYHWLDVNQSLTVDATDVNMITQKLLGNAYSTCYIRQYSNGYIQAVDMPDVPDSIILDQSVTEGNSRWYIGYSFLEDEPIERYQLTATMTTLGSTRGSQERSLINGDDNRGVAHGYENTGIVYIKNLGTGFIVGDHHIATAAHLFTFNQGVCSDFEIFTYDRSGAPVEGENLHAAEIHIPEDYSSPNNTFLDYALITVEEDLSEYVHFDIGNAYNMTNADAGSIPIHVTGMPASLGDELNQTNVDDLLYTHYGSVYGTDNRKFFKYSVDTSGSQSGAPVYTITRERYNNQDYYTYTALAVHTAGGGSQFNNGVLMTKYHQQFYNSNPYANY